MSTQDRSRRVVIQAMLGFLVSGCGSTALTQAPESPSLANADGSTRPGEIRLAAGDKIRVTVFGEDKLSGDFEVDPAGSVSLPLAGTMQAAGLTKPEFERQLSERLKGTYLRNPKVTVDVANFRPFYVLGEVQKPGEYPYRSGLNVLSAIAVAGGSTYRASTSKVLIQRSGTVELSEYPQSPTVSVMPGDVIRVPERYF